MTVSSYFQMRSQSRHKNENLHSHHDKLKKMLEATSKKKKIDEARKKLEDGEENDDGGGLQIKGDLKSDYECILQLDLYPLYSLTKT